MLTKKTYRKYAVTTMAATVGVAPVAISADTTKPFSDVTNGSVGEHYDAIMALTERGIINGYTAGEKAGKFGPWDHITRAQVAKMLARGLDVPEDIEGELNNFSDVNADHEYAAEIAAVVASGIFVGDAGQFRPWDKITREQMATVLVRAYGLADFDAENVAINLHGVHESHAENVQILANLGITTELSDFRPAEPIYRAGFATMMHRTLEVIENAGEIIKVINNMTVEITFKESIEDITADDFAIEGLEIENAVVKETSTETVVLTTSPQKGGQEYTITLNGERVGTFEGVYHSSVEDVTGDVFNVDKNKKLFALVLSDGGIARYYYEDAILKLDGESISTSLFETYIEDGATITTTYFNGEFTFNIVDPAIPLATLTDQQKVNYEILKANNGDTIILDDFAGAIEVVTNKAINIELAFGVTLDSLVVDTPHASFLNSGTVLGMTMIRDVKSNTFTNGSTGVLHDVIITDSDGTRFINDGEIRGTVEIRTAGDVVLGGEIGYNVTVTEPANITTDSDANISVTAEVDGVNVDGEPAPVDNVQEPPPPRPTPPPVPEKLPIMIEITSAYQISDQIEITYRDGEEATTATATVADGDEGKLLFTFTGVEEGFDEMIESFGIFTFDYENINYTATYSADKWTLEITEPISTLKVSSKFKISGPIVVNFTDKTVPATAISNGETTKFIFVTEDLGKNIEDVGDFIFSYEHVPGEVIVDYMSIIENGERVLVPTSE